MSSGGGTGRLTVGVNRECTWTAGADVSWITVSPASGQGDGAITYTVTANRQTSSRKGGITVNDRRVELTQAAAECAFSISPRQASVVATGDRVSVSVTAQAGCEWTASSQASWISVASGASGRGNGTVAVEAAPNTLAARTGTVRIAGQTFTLSQAAANGAPPSPQPPACPVTLSDTTRTFGAGGGNGSVNVRADSDCEWTAMSNASWITVTGDASGSGNDTVQYAVAANTSSSSRTGTLTVNGQTLTITQSAGAGCTFNLSPTSESFTAAGGTDTVDVETTGSCAWTATSNATWLTITSGASDTGDGTVRYAVAPNLSFSSRTGVLTIGSRTFTVTQAAATPEEVRLRGTISGIQGTCPTRSFSVDGRTVRINSSTTIRRGTCGSLSNGTEVTVDGLTQADNSVLATRVTIEEDD